MKVGVPSCECSHAGAWARDEIIVDDISIALSLAVSRNVTTATAPVVDNLGLIRTWFRTTYGGIFSSISTHIVLEVVHALNLGISCLVINIQVPEEADTKVTLHQPSTGVSLQTLSNDRILNRDVIDCAVN
jgi:hypothetical protein